jgi:hypothetical protein
MLSVKRVAHLYWLLWFAHHSQTFRIGIKDRFPMNRSVGAIWTLTIPIFCFPDFFKKDESYRFGGFGHVVLAPKEFFTCRVLAALFKV